MRHYSLIDQIVCRIDKVLTDTLSNRIGKSWGSDNHYDGNNLSNTSDLPGTNNLSGSSNLLDSNNSSDNGLSISLMRVNHTGEVCAQALYQGQALVARDKNLEIKLKQAAEEEQQHLNWCSERIQVLGGKTSLLNPLFAAGSFGIGVIAGLMGDKISLGFIAETEHQVMQHLDKHLELLPKNDGKSREILMKMREDESRHATNAIQDGGVSLPKIIRMCMAITAKVMTISTRYI